MGDSLELELGVLLRRAEALFGSRQVLSVGPAGVERSTYEEMAARARLLGSGLLGLGLEEGDRVATLCRNHHRHLEAYFGVPCSGLVLQPLSQRLHRDELAYVLAEGGARALIVDTALLPLVEGLQVEHVLDEERYEELLASAGPWSEPWIEERQAASLWFTSGTTGRPKGVLASHRSTVLHLLAIAGFSERVGPADTVMPVVPMSHAGAWGYPYLCALTGARLVLFGPYLDHELLLGTLEREAVTLAAGVPTIWAGLEPYLDRFDLSALRAIVVGGSAVPETLRAAYRRRGLRIIESYGMTESSPTATVEAGRPVQGAPLPFIEIRARAEDGSLVPWDGRSPGELELRGPWVASRYWQPPPLERNAGVVQMDYDRWPVDGWFRTGDVAVIHPGGEVELVDRLKDLIKSGGEWIVSLALEQAIAEHPSVAEAAVVGIPDPLWQERPLAVVVPAGAGPSLEEIRAFLAPRFPKWWLPDRLELVAEIPRTGTGKTRKAELRERFSR